MQDRFTTYKILFVICVIVVSSPRISYCYDGKRGAVHSEVQGESAKKYYELGKKYYSEGKYEEALKALKKALELDPTGYTLYYNIALVYEKMEEYDKAIEYLQKYLEVTPLDIDEQERIQLMIKRLEGAKVHFKPKRTTIVKTRIIRQTILRRWGRADWLFWTLLGVGVVTLGGATITGISAISNYNDAKSFVLGRDGSYTEREELISSTDKLSLATDILIGVGSLFAISAAVLFFSRENVKEEVLEIKEGEKE